MTDLYNEYKERMYYYAYSILHDDYLAEDAVNQAFLGIVQNAEKIFALDVSKINPAVLFCIVTRLIILTNLVTPSILWKRLMLTAVRLTCAITANISVPCGMTGILTLCWMPTMPTKEQC